MGIFVLETNLQVVSPFSELTPYSQMMCACAMARSENMIIVYRIFIATITTTTIIVIVTVITIRVIVTVITIIMMNIAISDVQAALPAPLPTAHRPTLRCLHHSYKVNS